MEPLTDRLNAYPPRSTVTIEIKDIISAKDNTDMRVVLYSGHVLEKRVITVKFTMLCM